MKTLLLSNPLEIQLYFSLGLTISMLIFGVLTTSNKTPEDRKNFNVCFSIVCFFLLNSCRVCLQLGDYDAGVIGKETNHLIHQMIQVYFIGTMIFMLLRALYFLLKSEGKSEINMSH